MKVYISADIGGFCYLRCRQGNKPSNKRVSRPLWRLARRSSGRLPRDYGVQVDQFCPLDSFSHCVSSFVRVYCAASLATLRQCLQARPVFSMARRIEIYKRNPNKIMDEEYSIVYVDKPEWGIIGPAISDYNKQQAGDDEAQNICFVLRTPDQTVVGGVIGSIYWDWFHISLMWVKEELRGRGYGQRLLTLAEDKARERGAKNVYLDTFSFQAPDFYKKYGYQVFGELADYPSGHQLYFLTKQL